MVDFRLHRRHAFELDIERLFHRGDSRLKRSEAVGLRAVFWRPVARFPTERRRDSGHGLAPVNLTIVDGLGFVCTVSDRRSGYVLRWNHHF